MCTEPARVFSSAAVDARLAGRTTLRNTPSPASKPSSWPNSANVNRALQRDSGVARSLESGAKGAGQPILGGALGSGLARHALCLCITVFEFARLRGLVWEDWTAAA